MGKAAELIGGDRLLISMPFRLTSLRFIIEEPDRLVPGLQRRGWARTAYADGRLRPVPGEF